MQSLTEHPITRRWPPHDPSLLQLYSFPTPNGVKVSIALEEMKLPYEAHTVMIGGDQHMPEFLSLNPNNKIPAIIDPNGPDGEMVALWESGAILLYLAEKTGQLMPGDARGRAETQQWLMFQMSGLGPMFGQYGDFREFAGKQIDDPRPRQRYIDESRWRGRPYAVLIVMLFFSVSASSCNRNTAPSQVSEKPDAIEDTLNTLTEPRASRFGLRARVSYDDIEAIAAEQLPDSYPIAGDRKVCKRIIGIKACGTAQWNLTVSRTAPITLDGVEQHITASAPIRFNGTVGIQGSVAAALGLSALDVQGEVMTTIRMGLNMQDDWCPVIRAAVSYQWVQKPTALWLGKMDFDLEEIVNGALDKQLATLEPRLNKAIDCVQFREQLAGYWHSYTFELDVPSPSDDALLQQVHLNIVPTGFAFSGIHTEPEKFGVSFEVEGTTVVASSALESQLLPLPPLREVAFQASRTDFDLLLRADYTQLEAAITPLLIDRNFRADSPAGKVSVQIESIKLTGSTSGVAVALGFVAQLPGSRRDTQGIIYLNASPEVDTTREQLRLENIRLSKVLDSALWDMISTVFEGQIIAAIERGSLIDLSAHTRKLEQRLQEQLQDPDRTGGVAVRAENLKIRLLGLFPEANSLAARAQVSAELDIDIPLTVLKKPLK